MRYSTSESAPANQPDKTSLSSPTHSKPNYQGYCKSHQPGMCICAFEVILTSKRATPIGSPWATPSGFDTESIAKSCLSPSQPQIQIPVTTANVSNHDPQDTQRSNACPSDSATLVGGTGSAAAASTGPDKLPEHKIFPGVVHEQAQRGSVLNRSTAEDD